MDKNIIDKQNTAATSSSRYVLHFLTISLIFFSVSEESKVTGHMQNPAELADESYRS